MINVISNLIHVLVVDAFYTLNGVCSHIYQWLWDRYNSDEYFSTSGFTKLDNSLTNFYQTSTEFSHEVHMYVISKTFKDSPSYLTIWK